MAQFGASLSETLFFTEDTSNSDISSIASTTKYKDVKTIVAYQDDQTARTESSMVNGQTITYQASSVTRLGEFNTVDIRYSGALADGCAIGKAILPQIIGFNIRPLWDPAFPLEYFMDPNTTDNFRAYIANATASYLYMANNCLDAQGQNCTANNGSCITDLTVQDNGTYAFDCVYYSGYNVSDSLTTNQTFTFQIYLINNFVNDDDNYENYVQTKLYSWDYPNPNVLYEIKPSDSPTGKGSFFFSPGDSYQTIRVEQWVDKNQPIGRNIDQALTIVVCPVNLSPASVSSTIPNSMCYRPFWVLYQDYYHSGIQFAVEFSLSSNYPAPSQVSFTKYLSINPKRGGQSSISYDPNVSVNQLERYLLFGALDGLV